ncbi:response regulator transcription factor [Inhella proteolytica]|uniref:Response regulator transcription factor n=1 Tax=Inhella proteolytica TaxID=2795029 RepID=A0A931J1S9_9BURK|nr:response regulator transcription factor [Inhella proteolytica]MBH9576580.1 response regulator transcription factor [Inhella proteolytica]
MRVLVVEDDTLLRDTLKRDLAAAGFAVDVAADGLSGEFLGASETYDAVVLDLGLPGLSGLEVLRRWREAGHRMPVIALTARDQWYERVEGLKAGADDYLGKPFHFEELLARLGALMRRQGGTLAPRLRCLGIELDEAHQAVIVDGVRREALTALEYRLLRYLVVHCGEVVSKATLGDHVYERDMDPDSNVIEVYVNRLRKKLGKDLIHTRRGQGYVLCAQP